MPKTLTRQSVSKHFIFGKGNELPSNVLPTNLQVGRYFILLKESPLSNNDILCMMADKLIDLWRLASIPAIAKKSVINKLKRFIDKVAHIKRSKTKTLLETFTAALQELFDISACKCPSVSHEISGCHIANCRETHILCNCPKESKVPKEELEFLLDQRNARRMVIGNVDITRSRQIAKREERKLKELESMRKRAIVVRQEPQCSTADSLPTDDSSSSNSTGEETPISDYDNFPTDRMTISLPNLAMEADRFGISDRAASAIASATLLDLGIVDEENSDFFIDRSKIRRERQKLRKSLQMLDSESYGNVKGIYFDGRRDRTLVKINKGGRWYKDVINEEHYVLIGEPGGEYLNHLNPKTGKAFDIAESILSYLTDINQEQNIQVIGCDSTNVNTGCKGGIIRYIENKLKRPLQWSICMLHTNELPLRHLFMHYDGKATGPSTFSGPIGNALKTCHEKPVVKFLSISVQENLPDLPDDVVDDLSSDQQYLLKIICAIRKGFVDKDLEKRKPGPLNNSRWITLANRICRYYVSQNSPPPELRSLVLFIVTNYGPNWFDIKLKPYLTDGPKHVFNAIKRLNYLPQDVRNVVQPYVARNSYFAHSENILLSMMADSDRQLRKRAIQTILHIRSLNPTRDEVREFRPPNLNLNPTHWSEIISLNEADISEPPLTSKLTEEELIQHEERCLVVEKFPIHTQAVERAVKLVTDASSSVISHDSRDGFIRAKIKSRSALPSVETKKDLKSLLKK